MPDETPSRKPAPALPRGHDALGLFDLALTRYDEPIRPDGFGEERWVMKAGSRVGPYRLVRELGEGGFGIVWLAHQLEPIQRDVAIKLIKPGMDSRRVIARFEAERQTLALMEHRNIAAVLDAGATGQGHPYFVMELVRGEPITTYCDRRNLSLHQRLELFIQVCHGVQHAHQKAILHRDLKPSNILIEEIDGAPAPKIIDFGIAKALERDSGDLNTSMYSRSVVIGTPQYMSPEQAGNVLDVDVCSDIYSLGTILFELLTGRPPFHEIDWHRVPLHKVLQIIHDSEPVRPSTAVLNSAKDPLMLTIAATRRSDPRKLSLDLRGDLDWIVLKALEKDRTRRYESASAFAADIQRHLGHEPVAARPPTRVYVLKKFVRRNRAAVLAGAFIALALLCGAGAAWWGYLGQKHALAQSRRLAGFFGDFFSEITARNSTELSAVTVCNLLNAANEQRRTQLQQDAETDAAISLRLAQSYCEINQLARAEDLFKNALSRFQQAGRDKSVEAAECRLQIVAIHLRNLDDDETGVTNGAPLDVERDLLERSLAVWRAVRKPDDPVILRAMALRAGLLRVEGKTTEARQLIESLLGGKEGEAIRCSVGVGWLHRERALLYMESGEFKKMIEGGLFRDPRQRDRLLENSDFKQMMDDLQRAWDMVNDVASTNQRFQIAADVNRLRRKICIQTRSFDFAEKAARDELSKRESWLGYKPPHVLNGLAEIDIACERFHHARAQLLDSISISRKHHLASSEERARRLLLEYREKLYGDDSESLPDQFENITELTRLLLTRADAALLERKPSSAILADAATVLQTLEEPRPPYFAGIAPFFAVRAALEARQARYAAAVALLEKALLANPSHALYRLQLAQMRLLAHDIAAFQSDRERLLKTLDRKLSPSDVVLTGRTLLLRSGLAMPSLQNLWDELLRVGAPLGGLEEERPADKAEPREVRGALSLEMDADPLASENRTFEPQNAGKDRDSGRQLNDWIALVSGLTRYRMGSWVEASGWMASAQQSKDPVIVVSAQFLAAMAQHQLNAPEAPRLLAVAQTEFDDHFARFAGTDTDPAMHDYLSVKFLKDEAETLFGRTHAEH